MQSIKIGFKGKILIPTIVVLALSILIVSANSYRLLNSVVRSENNAKLDIFTADILKKIKTSEIIMSTTKQTLSLKHLSIAKSIRYVLENVNSDITSEELQWFAEALDIIEINICNIDGILINSNKLENIGFDFKAFETTQKYMQLVNGTLSELTEDPRPSLMQDAVSNSTNYYTGISLSNGLGFIQLGFDSSVLDKLHNEVDFTEIIRKTRLDDNGYGMVIKNDSISVHPNAAMLNLNVSTESWFQKVCTGDGFAWIEFDNTKYYAGYKNSDGITVIGLIPRSDYYKELTEVIIETIIFLGLAITVMFIMLYNVINSTIKAERTVIDLTQKAYFDALTEIHNRRYLNEQLKRNIKSLSRTNSDLSVLLIDIDFFKKYNDFYNHSEGDKCLKSVARALANSVLRKDDYVARYGGEEFAVILPNTNGDSACMIARRMIENIRALEIVHEKSDVSNFVTISIGITTSKVKYNQNGEDYIKKADEALYISKENGRNQYTFLPLN